MSKYYGTMLRMTQKGVDYQPQPGRNPNTNRESWDVVKAMFRVRTRIPFEHLAIATTGHVHGSRPNGRDGGSSDSYVRYLIRSKWLEVV